MNTTEFSFTSVSDEKALKNINNDEVIEKAFNSNMKINNYTNIINEILFVYVAANSKSIPRPDKLSYLRKSKTLQIVYNLNYETFVIAQQEQATKLMAEAYLQAIEKYLIDRKDFNGKKFYEDVKLLFVNNGIL